MTCAGHRHEPSTPLRSARWWRAHAPVRHAGCRTERPRALLAVARPSWYVAAHRATARAAAAEPCGELGGGHASVRRPPTRPRGRASRALAAWATSTASCSRWRRSSSRSSSSTHWRVGRRVGRPTRPAGRSRSRSPSPFDGVRPQRLRSVQVVGHDCRLSPNCVTRRVAGLPSS